MHTTVFILIVLITADDVLASGTIAPTRQIAPGVMMPRVNLGHPDKGRHIGGNETASLLLWLSPQVNGSGVDTAYDYHNQKQIGVAIAASKRPRESIFVTTKVPGTKGRAGAMSYVKTDLAQMGLAYADLVLIHCPSETCPGWRHSSAQEIQDTWLGLEDALHQGLTRAIGVSNFAVADLQAILDMDNATTPAVNQCQMSVGSHDDATIAFCQKNNIAYEAYSPLGRGSLNTSDPRIVKIAANHPGKSTFQVCLRPSNFLRNTFSDQTRCIAQLRPGSSFLLSVLRFLDRMDRAAGLPHGRERDETGARPERFGPLRL